MSFLITGANGHVGSDLVNILSKKYKVYGVYRTKNQEVKKIKNVIWIKFDLKKKLQKKINPKPKFIIHCAVDQRPLKTNTNNYISTNILMLNNLINYAKKNKIKLIINLSSIDVYGNIKTKFLDENYLPQKLNAYAQTKLKSEQILHNQKINFVNLRLPGILCKPNRRKLNRPWLSQISNKIQKNESIFVHNIKSKFNNVIDTQEIARFVGFLIKKNLTIRDTFNLASNRPIILKDVLKIIKNKLRSKSVIREVKNHKKNSFYISTKKIEKKLKYKTYSTKKTITKYLDEFLQYAN